MIEKESLIVHNLIILEKSMISNKKKEWDLVSVKSKILHISLPEFKIRTLILTKKFLWKTFISIKILIQKVVCQKRCYV